MSVDITKKMELVLYKTEDDNVTVSALVKDETIWLTQKAMAELFGVQIPAISKHLKNIFAQGELREEVVVSKMENTTIHGAIPGKTQFSESVNAFLEFRRYDILKDNGRVSHKKAVEKAHSEYEIFNRVQPIESDFDRAVKSLIESQKE